MVEVRGEVVDFEVRFSPGTSDTVPVELTLIYKDGGKVKIAAEDFRFDQYSREPSLCIHYI